MRQTKRLPGSRWNRACSGILGSLALATLACTTPVSSGSAIHPKLQGKSADELHGLFTKTIHPATNLAIHATYWDLSLVEAQKDMLGSARFSQWVQRYIRGKTSFTVVIELANRPGQNQSDLPISSENPEPKTPTEAPIFSGHDDINQLEDPKAWSFWLEGVGEERIQAGSVEVQAIERFPTRAKGWHWRIVMALHFPSDISKKAKSNGSSLPITLRVCAPDEGDAMRYGRRSHEKGFPIRWKITG